MKKNGILKYEIILKQVVTMGVNQFSFFFFFFLFLFLFLINLFFGHLHECEVKLTIS